ncbi:MAG: biopolymer transporter ExbD [Saprospiraceae bacterium]
MAKKSGKEKVSNEINAGSMADIAFLLLIFFLVTTTMDQDKGLLVKLPPYVENTEQIDVKINKRNLFTVLVNANDQLLVRGEVTDVNALRDKAKEFILNPNNAEDMAISPSKAIISLKNDRGTHYDKYIAVYNELKSAYTELRDETAMRKFNKHMDDLPSAKQDTIKNMIPMILSEAESTNFGEERK